ncbi:MAG: hypothetical protein ACE5DP_02520 [Fidelibacterota bacterium]
MQHEETGFNVLGGEKTITRENWSIFTWMRFVPVPPDTIIGGKISLTHRNIQQAS